MPGPLPPLKKKQRFGSYTVKNPKYDDKYRVECECDCGNIRWVKHGRLRSGKTTCCMSCLRRKEQVSQKMEVTRGQIYDPWEVFEDAAGSKTRVRVRCTGCNQRTTRKLLGIVEGKHKCLNCFNKSRGSKFVIYDGRTIPLVELMKSAETLTIVASSIQATPKENTNLSKQIRNFIAETGQITQTPQALIVQVREGQ